MFLNTLAPRVLHSSIGQAKYDLHRNEIIDLQVIWKYCSETYGPGRPSTSTYLGFLEFRATVILRYHHMFPTGESVRPTPAYSTSSPIFSQLPGSMEHTIDGITFRSYDVNPDSFPKESRLVSPSDASILSDSRSSRTSQTSRSRISKSSRSRTSTSSRPTSWAEKSQSSKYGESFSLKNPAYVPSNPRMLDLDSFHESSRDRQARMHASASRSSAPPLHTPVPPVTPPTSATHSECTPVRSGGTTPREHTAERGDSRAPPYEQHDDRTQLSDLRSVTSD